MKKVLYIWDLVYFCLETINLVNCITMNYEKEFKPLTIGCWEEHMVELGNKLGHKHGHKPDEIEATEICRSVPFKCLFC